MSTWARSWRSGPGSMNTRSVSASLSKFMPAAGSANAAARACTHRATTTVSITATWIKVIAPTGFTTDGGFCEYQVNNINTLVALADEMTDEEGTLVVTAGTAMYALTELGGLVAGESVCVTGPGPIGLMAVAVAKALGAHPVILTGTRDNRLKIGLELGADAVVNIRKEPDVVAAVKKLNGGKGVDYVVECSAATSAVNDAVRMVNRGGRVCLAAFAHEEVPVDVAHIVRNNIYVYGIRGEGKSANSSRRGLHETETVRRHEDSYAHISTR